MQIFLNPKKKNESNQEKQNKDETEKQDKKDDDDEQQPRQHVTPHPVTYTRNIITTAP